MVVLIKISGRQSVEADNDCSTSVVEAKMLQAFGRGLLKRNGRLVTTATLAEGEYDYDLAQQRDAFSCVVRFNRAVLNFSDLPIDLDALQERIESAWTHFAVMRYSLFYCRQDEETAVSDTLKLRDLLSSAAESSFRGPHVFKVKKDCHGFSEYCDAKYAVTVLTKLKAVSTELAMIPQANDKFALTNPQDWEQLIASEASLIQSELDRRRVIDLFPGVSEYTKREFISPILIGSLQCAKGISMLCEKKIVGSFGNGPVDYSLIYRNINIVLTEAKRDKLEGGLVQNLVQQEASHESLAFAILPPDCRGSRNARKRKYDEISKELATLPSYGIVTDGEHWMFSVIEREPQSNRCHIYKSSLHQLLLHADNDVARATQLDQIKSIVERIVAVCLKQKDLIDNNEQLKALLSGSNFMTMTIEDSLVASLESTTKKQRSDGDEDEDDDEND